MVPDEPTRRRALKLMQSTYHRLYGAAKAEAEAEWLDNTLSEMARRMAETPGGWHDHADASTMERLAAVLFLPLDPAERGRLDAIVEAAIKHHR